MRLESNRRLVQRTSRDFLTACELLDFLLVQLSIFVALGHGDKPLALETCKGRAGGFCVLLPVSPADHTDRGNLGVVSEHGFNRVEQCRFSVTGCFAMQDKHTLLVAHAEDRVAEGALQEVSFILFALRHLVNELFPSVTLDVSADGVTEIGLHGEKIIPLSFPKRKIPEGVGAVQTVYKVWVSVKLSGRDTKLACSVFEYSVSHAPVTHFVHKRGVGFSDFIIHDLPAVENHQPHKVLDFLRDKDRPFVFAPCALEVGVPALMLCAVSGFPVVEHTKQVCHAHFRPFKPGTGFIGFLRVI